MILNKKELCTGFTRASKTYQSNALVQAKMAESLFELIRTENVHKVYEIGCGTGTLSQMIVDSLDFQELVLNDLSQAMIDLCKDRFKGREGIIFDNSDAENIDFKDRNYDLIVSNACFQWLECLEEDLKNYCDHLSDSGQLVFSIFSKGNFEQFRQISNVGLDYHDAEEIEKILKKLPVRYQIKEHKRVTYYQSVEQMLRSLKMTGVVGLSKQIWTKGRLQDFIRRYAAQYTDKQGISLDWCYLLVSCTKE
ncbi:MAG: malonyl-ACP O-methyltransferase BioC [Succinivibrio sp.]